MYNPLLYLDDRGNISRVDYLRPCRNPDSPSLSCPPLSSISLVGLNGKLFSETNLAAVQVPGGSEKSSVTMMVWYQDVDGYIRVAEVKVREGEDFASAVMMGIMVPLPRPT